VIADPQAFVAALGGEAAAALTALTGMDWTDPNTVMAVVGGGFRGTTFS
jgi:hypothetical protein